jgi:hypothetical protein
MIAEREKFDIKVKVKDKIFIVHTGEESGQ